MIRLSLCAPVLVSALSGCATITTDSGQSIRVETFADNGEEIRGAQCKLENDNGSYQVTTPASVTVRKASTDLMMDCTAPNQPAAKASVTSRVGPGMFGNIIFGGGIGAIIDHSKGTAYNYPTWLQLVFGRTLNFDRNEHEDGKPTPAFETKDGKREPYKRPSAGSGAPVAVPK
jgi:hypothetical protein